MKRSEALKLRTLIERAAESLTDKEASEWAMLWLRRSASSRTTL